MKEYYQSKLTDKTPPGGVFTAKTATCTITAYKSGKVLFQGSGCEDEAKKWGNIPAADRPKNATKRSENQSFTKEH